jgi:hypothetical protein
MSKETNAGFVGTYDRGSLPAHLRDEKTADSVGAQPKLELFLFDKEGDAHKVLEEARSPKGGGGSTGYGGHGDQFFGPQTAPSGTLIVGVPDSRGVEKREKPHFPTLEVPGYTEPMRKEVADSVPVSWAKPEDMPEPRKVYP